MLPAISMPRCGARRRMCASPWPMSWRRRHGARRRPPRSAALLTVACIDGGRPDLLREEWTTRILRAQRSDGSWIGEPFAAAPNRGHSVSWYSSSMLTTALCYDALGRAARPTPSRQAAAAGSEVQ